MRWKGRKQSSNVEDRRGKAARQIGIGGGLIGVVIAVVVTLMSGGDLGQVVESVAKNNMGGGQQSGNQPYQATKAEEEMKELVSVVLHDTEVVWADIFKNELGKRYREPKLILFTEAVNSACGYASSATGPFYCPGDDQVYIDLGFFKELKTRFKAPGDFAIAYVVAHEVGHHVQHLLGISDRVHAQKRGMSKAEANAMSVRLELQADFFAGLWAHHAHDMANILEKGDLEEALKAANAIGDDRLQKQAQGYVVPESFTHGTSAQRMRWFKRGFETGDFRQGDTFATEEL